MTTNTQSKEESITEDEAALYDRQIRLWGLDAQKRLRAASILLIGLRGLGAEVAKNIVLAGVKSVTLLDSTVADDEDMASQFLIPRSEIGKNRAQASLERTQQLNPMVHVTVDTESIDDKDDDFIASFDVVCATGCGVSTLKHLDAICRSHGVKFYAGDVFGFYGFVFADLGTHHYAEYEFFSFLSLKFAILSIFPGVLYVTFPAFWLFYQGFKHSPFSAASASGSAHCAKKIPRLKKKDNISFN